MFVYMHVWLANNNERTTFSDPCWTRWWPERRRAAYRVNKQYTRLIVCFTCMQDFVLCFSLSHFPSLVCCFYFRPIQHTNWRVPLSFFFLSLSLCVLSNIILELPHEFRLKSVDLVNVFVAFSSSSNGHTCDLIFLLAKCYVIFY